MHLFERKGRPRHRDLMIEALYLGQKEGTIGHA